MTPQYIQWSWTIDSKLVPENWSQFNIYDILYWFVGENQLSNVFVIVLPVKHGGHTGIMTLSAASSALSGRHTFGF